MLEIRIMDMEQLLVTGSSRGRCNWDVGTACWRKEVEIERQGIGWICVHGR